MAKAQRIKIPASREEKDASSWLDVPRSIWYFIEKDRKKWVLFNLILFFIFFYSLVPPFIIGLIVEFFLHYHSGDSLVRAYSYAFILGISYIAVALIRLKSKNILDKIAIAARSRAKVLGFERMMEFSLKWHSEENTGNKVQRILTGSQAIYEWSTLNSREIYPITASFLSVLGFFLIRDPLFSLFLVAYAVIFFIVEYHFNWKIEKLSDKLNKFREQSSGAYIEGTGNILAIKALGATQGIQSKINTNEEKAREVEFQISDTGIVKWYWFRILDGLTYIIFALSVIYQVSARALSISLIVVFLSYFNNLRESLANSSDLTNKMLQFKSDLAHMMPVFRDSSPVKTGNAPFPKIWGTISIENGTFKYPSGQIGFRDLNFTVQHGERLGIAGASGSGKSTLAKVLLGLYELSHGTFRIDREDYYSMAHDEISKNIAVVLQETELFNLSLRENITVMREENPTLLHHALHISKLKEVVDRLPQGLDTLIGERGYFLSGGERQRLGIARAIYKNADIILFDEATSALDVETEKLIMDKLFVELGGHKTLIMIAHRLSTLRNTDRVVVFDAGKIIEEGAFEHLVRKPKSRLGHLYSLQSAKTAQS